MKVSFEYEAEEASLLLTAKTDDEKLLVDFFRKLLDSREVVARQDGVARDSFRLPLDAFISTESRAKLNEANGGDDDGLSLRRF